MSGDYRQGASPYSLWRHSDGQGDARRQTSGKPDKSGTFKYNPPRLKQGYITPNTNLRDTGPQGRADDPEEATGQPYEARGQPDVENDQPEVTRVQLGEPRGQPNKVRGKTTSHNSSLLDYNFGDDVTTPIAPFTAPLIDKNQDIQKQKQQKQETNLHQRSTPDARLLKRIDGVKKQINSADNNIYVENADEGCQLIKSESEQQPRYPLNSKRELEQESHRYNQEQHEQQQQKQRDTQHQQQLEKQYKQQQLEKQHQQQLEKQLILKLEKQKQLELEKQKHAKIQEHRRNQIQNEQQQHLTLHHHQQQHQQQYQQQFYQQQQYQQYQQHYQKQCQQQYQQQQQHQQQKHQQQHGLHNNGFGRTYVPNPNTQVVPSKVVAGSQLMDQVCPDSEWFLRNAKEHPGIIKANGGHNEGTQSNDSWSLGDEKRLKETSPKTHHSDGKYTKVFSNKLSNKMFLPMDDEPTIPGKLAQGVINNNNQCPDQDFVVHHMGERQSCKHKIKDPVPFQRCEPKERTHSVVLERCERNEHGPFGRHGKQSDDSLCRDYKQVKSPKTQTQNCMKRERSDRFRSSFNPNEVMEDTKSIVRNVKLNRATRDKSVEDFNYSKIYDNQHNQVYHKSPSFQRSARKGGDVSYNTQEEGQRQYDYSWFLHLQDLQKQRLKESLGITTAADPVASCREPLANTSDSPYEVQKTAKSNYGENNILQSTHDQIEDFRCQRKEFKSEVSTFDEQEKLAKDEENIMVVKCREKCNREKEEDRGHATLESSPKKQHTKSLVISPETKCDSNVSPRPIGKLVKLFQDIKLFTPKDASPTRYTSPECGLITNPLIPTPSPPEDAPRHNIDQPEPPSRSDIESLRSVTQFLLSQQSPQRFLFTSPSCARQTQTVEQAQSSPSIERQTQTHPIAVVKRDYDATPVRVPSAIPGVDALVPPMRTRVNRSAHGRSSSRPERAQSPRPSLARTASQSSPPSKSRSKATVHIRRLSPSDSNTGVAHRARKSTKKSTTTLV